MGDYSLDFSKKRYTGVARVLFPVVASAWSLNQLSTGQPPKLAAILLLLVVGVGGFASSYYGIELLDNLGTSAIPTR